MGKRFRIVTVGLSPAWDITCKGEHLEWGEHKVISETSCRPAGKALNISRALAWMGQASTAAGLWGRSDYEQMVEGLRPKKNQKLKIKNRRSKIENRNLKGFIRVKMTAVAGATRRNVTVVDTARKREMHLRSRSELATRGSLRRLRGDLRGVVSRPSVCVFAGAMADGELLGEVIRVVKVCRSAGGRVAVDTSGAALSKLVDAGGLWLIKPNVEELCELLGERIENRAASLAKAARALLDRAGMVLVSRGSRGVVLVTNEGAFSGRVVGGERRAVSTVGCGDYLVAGFLAGLREGGDIGSALKVGLQAATARAWGWWESKRWTEVKEEKKVEVKEL